MDSQRLEAERQENARGAGWAFLADHSAIGAVVPLVDDGAGGADESGDIVPSPSQSAFSSTSSLSLAATLLPTSSSAGGRLVASSFVDPSLPSSAPHTEQAAPSTLAPVPRLLPPPSSSSSSLAHVRQQARVPAGGVPTTPTITITTTRRTSLPPIQLRPPLATTAVAPAVTRGQPRPPSSLCRPKRPAPIPFGRFPATRVYGYIDLKAQSLHHRSSPLAAWRPPPPPY